MSEEYIKKLEVANQKLEEKILFVEEEIEKVKKESIKQLRNKHAYSIRLEGAFKKSLGMNIEFMEENMPSCTLEGYLDTLKKELVSILYNYPDNVQKKIGVVQDFLTHLENESIKDVH